MPARRATAAWEHHQRRRTTVSQDAGQAEAQDLGARGGKGARAVLLCRILMREELPPVEARGQRVEAGRDVAAGSIGGRRKHRSILQ